MEIKEGFDSNYRYVLVAARRARQLQNGSQPLVHSTSGKACRVAQDELNAGAVGFTTKKPAVEHAEPAVKDLHELD
ncbi:MAG: DNA-directed RNA polymerase subunit omega [Acidobacteriaceae bacterium]